MIVDLLALQARANLDRLQGISYPGRGVFVGLTSEGTYALGTWTMGRSENSRNRIYSTDGGRVFTEAADPEKVKDPRLIIYNAMNEHAHMHVASNGDQTDTVLDGLCVGHRFDELIRRRDYEPDAPNFTPRITALLNLGQGPRAEMAMTRKSPWGDGSDHLIYTFAELGRGIGHCLVTYEKDGDPLPSYRGEPFLLPLTGDGTKILISLWEALDKANRVSAAVKIVPKNGTSEIFVVNKYSKVAEPA